MSCKWIELQLGEFIELKRGYDLPKKNRQEGTVPLVSSAGVSDSHSEAKVQGPGVVTGRYGTIGEVFYIEEDFWPLNTTLYVRDFKGNHPRFVAYLLQTIDFHQFSDKAAVPGVNRNHVHLALIRVPERYEDQEKIADYVATIERKIALNTQTNQTLEQIAQALFKSWFVDFGPVIDNALAAGNPIPEPLAERARIRQALFADTATAPARLPAETLTLFPDSFVEHAEMGWIPAGWEARPVGDVIDNVGGATPKTSEPLFWENGSHAFCTPKDMSSLGSKVILDTERKLTDVGVNKISSGQLSVGTVVMSSRAPIGYLAITKLPISVNQGIIALKPDDQFGSEFLLFWLEANQKEVITRANGSTFLEISKKNFRTIPFLIPPEELCLHYNDQAKACMDAVYCNTRQTQELTKLRDTLLPKLLSGELTLPELEAQAESC
ncbi:MAG: restriction endonuclease subunit S [Marinobacterium sp.]|nr:restriction endonuclease subunit S [Marinobacterium sp.]